MPRPLLLGHRARCDEEGRWVRGEPVEIDADALVRHAFVCGASGFGKTVFCKGLVEEAILAGIPVIAVDFKGDLASLALCGTMTRPEALEAVFGDEGAGVAAEFEEGGRSHGADPQRAARYAERALVRLFTPNSSLGRRLALSALPSFPDPPRSDLEREERDELIQALVGGFAQIMYGTASATKKNEPAVKLLEELVRWCADRGESLEGAAGIARVLELVASPPFAAMGGMAMEDYLPERDKKRLMQQLNSRLLGAERLRYEGQLLSVETLLGGVPSGKVPLSIVYLGHISDFTEQSAVLGQLCADVYRWMRRTGGSSGVRLLMYVDELGGGDARHAFYPSAPHDPPSKAPLNLLVRQARSAGVGMLLATQNPMSVDVRGLGNINTWAVGRLTRKNDHTRIEDLLARMPEGSDEGAAVVSRLPPGVLLAVSDGLDGPTYVQERWLYSVHRQLSPASVGAISEQIAEAAPAPAPRPPPPPPPPSPEPLARSAPSAPPPTLASPAAEPAMDPSPAPDPSQADPAPATGPVEPRERRRRRQARQETPEPAPPPRPALSGDEDERSTLRDIPLQRGPALPLREATPPPPSPRTSRPPLIARAERSQPAPREDDPDTDALLLDSGGFALPSAARRPSETQWSVVLPEEPDETSIEQTSAGTTRRFAEPPPGEEDPTHAAKTAAVPARTEGPPPLEASPILPPASAPTRIRRLPSARETQILERDDDHEHETLTLTRFAAVAQQVWVLKAGRRSWTVGVGRPVRIGRSSRADAQLDDPHVSRLQVELVAEEAGLIVRQLRSKNPTLLDGTRLETELRILPANAPCTLRVGQTDLVISCEERRR